jgi:hypothetical protein
MSPSVCTKHATVLHREAGTAHEFAVAFSNRRDDNLHLMYPVIDTEINEAAPVTATVRVFPPPPPAIVT